MKLAPPDAVLETYIDSCPVIRKIVKRHVRHHGGNYHELLADTNLMFAEAFGTYDYTKKVRWNTWLTLVIGRRLLNEQVRSRRRDKLIHRDERADPDTIGREDHKFSLKEFTGGLSKDAARVVRLVLKPPRTVDLMPERRGAVRQFLRSKGWKRAKIDQVFAEIRNAL